jgi:Zinc dependent phospholipase C
MRFPHLAHRSAAAHKLHSTPQQHGMNLISGNGEPTAGYRPLAYSSPEAVQTTGTVALNDFFGFFSLGLDKGYDEQAYFWSDMLHYRDTGQFARAIWRRADQNNDDQQRAYALGYITHVATDVTGHPFVNAIAGGPFRTHWQRHHLVENHMDSLWYLNDALGPTNGDQYSQLTESALYYDIAFAHNNNNGVVSRCAYPAGGTMRDKWSRQRLLDLDSTMPTSLAQLLIDAMTDVWYQSPDTSGGNHPKILSVDGRPTVSNISEAYHLLYRYLKYVTLDGFHHEPPDPPEVFPNLLFPTIREPSNGAAPGDSSDDGNFWDDALDFFLAAIRVLGYIVEVAEYLATLPWAILADLTTYGARLGLYYALELPLFDLLKCFRAGLVRTGYMLPMDDEIIPSLALIGTSNAQGFSDLLGAISDVFGGLLPAAPPPVTSRFPDPEYPHSIVFGHSTLFNGDVPSEFRAPWNYPSSPVETHFIGLVHESPPGKPFLNSTGQYATTVGPYPQFASPSVLFGGAGQDPGLRDRFEMAETAGDADVVGMAVTPTAHLGDSVAFSQYLLWLETRTPTQSDGTAVPVVEWNLDSDMGYGYHCWDWNRSDVPATDPEGNTVL